MIKTNAVHRNYDPNSPYKRASDSQKWMGLLRHTWYEKGEYEGKGVIVILSDPNALFERLDLLLASKEAGNTGVENEAEAICYELKRRGHLDTRSYKKLNSIIKK